MSFFLTAKNAHVCSAGNSRRPKTLRASTILAKCAVPLLVGLTFTGAAYAQVADGVQDTDFPESYWALDYYAGRDGIVGDSGSFANPAAPNGSAGAKSWLGERFVGIGSFNNLFQSNGSLPQMRWSQDETPLFPTKPSGFVPVTATFPDPGDPHYQIDFRRKFSAAGTLEVGGVGNSADDTVEVFIDGVRVFNERGTAPTENTNTQTDITIPAGSDVLIKFINLGWIGGYLFEANFVPDVNVLAADNDVVPGIVDATMAQTGVVNVLDGDTLNFVQVVESDVTLAPVGALPAGFTLNSDGTVDIAAGTASNNYSFDYKVCEAGVTPENCATATVAITIDTPSADLSISKTNTPGVNGEVDQASDTVTSGSNTTYTLVVTNSGPDSATGAVVSDTPTSGLTCTGTDAVTLTGDGVPAGTFTIADLTGAGITLDTLTDGQSTTLTYSCEVN